MSAVAAVGVWLGSPCGAGLPLLRPLCVVTAVGSQLLGQWGYFPGGLRTPGPPAPAAWLRDQAWCDSRPCSLPCFLQDTERTRSKPRAPESLFRFAPANVTEHTVRPAPHIPLLPNGLSVTCSLCLDVLPAPAHLLSPALPSGAEWPSLPWAEGFLGFPGWVKGPDTRRPRAWGPSLMNRFLPLQSDIYSCGCLVNVCLSH